jgi:hypothetical protein
MSRVWGVGFRGFFFGRLSQTADALERSLPCPRLPSRPLLSSTLCVSTIPSIPLSFPPSPPHLFPNYFASVPSLTHTETHTHTHTHTHSHTRSHAHIHIHRKTRAHTHNLTFPLSICLAMPSHPPQTPGAAGEHREQESRSDDPDAQGASRSARASPAPRISLAGLMSDPSSAWPLQNRFGLSSPNP